MKKNCGPGWLFTKITSSDLCVIKRHSQNLYLQVGLTSHSLSTYVIKTYVKIYKYFLNHRMGIKTIGINIAVRQFILIQKAHVLFI